MENLQEESCTKCQQPLLPGARFCGSCGTVVPTEPELEPETVPVPVPAPVPTTAPDGCSRIGFLVFLVIVIGFIWCNNVAQQRSSNQAAPATTAPATTNTPNATPDAIPNVTPTPQPQSGNVAIDANSGKTSAPAANSKPSDSAAIRAFAEKVKNNADKINECQNSLTALMIKPQFGDANWTVSMAIQISMLDSLADEGLAISTNSQACKPALQLWHQAMNEYKFVTKHLPIAVDSGSKNEYNVTVQHLNQATQYGVQALDMVQELAKSVVR